MISEPEPTEIPEYKQRAKIDSLASRLVASDEPAAGAEDCGMTPAEVYDHLQDLEREIEQAKDAMFPDK